MPDSKAYIFNYIPVLPTSETGYLFQLRESCVQLQTCTDTVLQMLVVGSPESRTDSLSYKPARLTGTQEGQLLPSGQLCL